jgi:hypothetical protein
MKPKTETVMPTEAQVGEEILALYSGLNVQLGGNVLPKPGDDIEYQFGLPIYEQMRNEPMLTALDDIVRILVLEAPLDFEPAVKAPGTTEEDYEAQLSQHEKAEEVRLFVKSEIKNLKSNIKTVLWEALEGYSVGHKLFEIVYEIGAEGIHIADLKPKGKKLYTIVVDNFMNTLGIIPGLNDGKLGFLQDAKTGLIGPEKFWVFAPRIKDGDPRGVAAYRACYAPWYEKQLTRPESLKFLKQFGGGMISLELPEITEKNRYVTVDGVKYERVVYYQSILTKFAVNGGAFSHEHGANITVHSSNGEGKAFQNQFDRSDREMALAFLKSTRAILEAQHGSKADSETSLDLLSSLVEWLRDSLCESIMHVVKLMVLLRFGVEAVQNLLPTATLAELQKEDIPALLSALSQALAAGMVTPEQLPYWDQKLGQPVRVVTEGEEVSDGSEEEQEDDAPKMGASFRTKSKANSERERLSQRYEAATEQLPQVSR